MMRGFMDKVIKPETQTFLSNKKKVFQFKISVIQHVLEPELQD